jgi:fructose 1,6-bisphosphatase
MCINNLSVRDKALYYVLFAISKKEGPILIDDAIDEVVKLLFKNNDLLSKVAELLKIDVDVDSLVVNITDKTRASVFNIVFFNSFATTGHFKGISITESGLEELNRLNEIVTSKNPVLT